MGKTKKELRLFNVTQYNQEEEYLSSMHRKGWKFTKVYFPGVYCFEECKPENVTYRLDYNQEGIRNKAEYVQMFSDCGWEYLMDFAGYSYFRKTISESDSNDEISQFTVEIQEDGIYEIQCKGRSAKGHIEFVIKQEGDKIKIVPYTNNIDNDYNC